MVDKLALVEVFLRVPGVFVVSIIPPLLHTYLNINTVLIVKKRYETLEP
jgi:hypothetical protein